MIRAVVRMAAWIFLFWVSVAAGIRWQAVAQPNTKVDVTLEDGRRLSGELRTTWDGSKILVDARAKSHLFRESDIAVMVIEVPEGRQPFPWRALAPLLLFTTITAWRTISQMKKIAFKDRENA